MKRFTPKQTERMEKIIEKFLKDVKKYSHGKVDQVFREISTVTDEQWKRINMFRTDVSYEKSYCNALGVDYLELPEEDRQRIAVFAYLVIKECPYAVIV